MKKIALTHVLAFMFTPLAYAHPGHGFDHGFMPGFMHPLLGWDHLLVMLAVGVLAAKLGGKARWQLPLTFLMMMAIGAMLGAAWGCRNRHCGKSNGDGVVADTSSPCVARYTTHFHGFICHHAWYRAWY
jgi:hypothetical protein